MESQDKIILKLPCKPEYVSVARLTVSGIASRMGFDIETVEDIKVAISEVCNRIIDVASSSDRQYEVWFNIGAQKLTICFNSDIERIDCMFSDDEEGLGVAIINAFMDEVEYCPKGKSYILSMAKYNEVITCNGL